jgi:SAM-dependent methyltransferase
MNEAPHTLRVDGEEIALLRPLEQGSTAGLLRDAALADGGAPYDRKAAGYDRLMRSERYHRLAWSSSPAAYVAFARPAITGSGFLLDVGCGTLANLGALYRERTSAAVLVDRSAAMLELAARELEGATAPKQLVVGDVHDLPFKPGRFDVVLAHGLLHLFDEPGAVAARLVEQVKPGGCVYVSVLTGATRRGRAYLRLLQRAGEVGSPHTPDQLHAALEAIPGARLERFGLDGCMATAVLVR